MTTPDPVSAYADESFHEASGANGFYVLATSIFPSVVRVEARQVVHEQLGNLRSHKLHWVELDRRRKLAVVAAIADLDAMHVVTVGAPVPPRRQERARAVCLQATVFELHTRNVNELCMEARTAKLNERDVKTVIGARYTLPKGAVFRVSHQVGAKEPLLWVADTVAGAVRAHRQGTSMYREILGDRIDEIHLNTNC